MSQRIVTCVKCKRERYESRMSQAHTVVSDRFGFKKVGSPVEAWYCSATASCKSYRKRGNRERSI